MITTTSTIQTAMTGMQRSVNSLGQNAAEIASASQMEGRPVSDISKPLVDQTQNLLHVEASAKVLKASDDMIGRLLDITA